MPKAADVTERAGRKGLAELSDNHISREAVPYLLATLDATVISLSGLFGGFSTIGCSTYRFTIFPLFCSRLNREPCSYRQAWWKRLLRFENAAKPTAEMMEVLLSWFGTGLLLAFFAFLLKIGDAFSRGSFLVFWALTPIGLLASRRIVKSVIRRAAAQGTIGRRNIVLLGCRDEIDALQPCDLLAFFGASDVHRFMLSSECDPRERRSDDAKTLELIAAFIRNYDAAEIPGRTRSGSNGCAIISKPSRSQRGCYPTVRFDYSRTMPHQATNVSLRLKFSARRLAQPSAR